MDWECFLSMFIILLIEIVFSPICVYTGFGPFPENKAFDCSQEATFRSDPSPPPHPRTEILLSVRGCLRTVFPGRSLYGVPFGSIYKTY
ncbi:hypothetical protein DPMN_153970 [Dreissena polymorpha]|uniref:Uncharacterized protein n=1 Tax=Dreissena polymorpha TaxID=45954 RepID=A0A9D4FL38_DREPO|nr:hypothetical protein DPMN_153970 [Dreissena polymorpha]